MYTQFFGNYLLSKEYITNEQLFDALKEKTQKRYDFVFVARSKTPELKSTKIYSLMMKNILSKLS